MDLGAEARRVHRAQILALSLVLLALGCAGSQSKPAAALRTSERARTHACSARALPKPAARAELPFDEPPLEPIAGIEVTGTERVSPELVRGAITAKPGERLDRGRLSDDVRRIWQLEVFDDVSVDWMRRAGGLWLGVHVSERPLVGHVYFRGRPEQLAELGLERDRPYEPARLHRRARDLEHSLIDDGYRRARVALSGVREAGRVDVCALVEPGPRVLIERLEFVGNRRVSAAELRAQMHTADGRINTPGAPYRDKALEHDLLFMNALYYDRGMVTVRIVPHVRQSSRGMQVLVEIAEGPVYRIGELSFTGALVAPAKRYRELLGARPGEVFSRAAVARGIDRINQLHHALGRDDVWAEPNTKLRENAARIDIELALVRR